MKLDKKIKHNLKKKNLQLKNLKMILKKHKQILNLIITKQIHIII